MNFPLPIAVFQLDDTRIVWANEEFFRICGTKGTRYDARMADFLPDFNSKWLTEGKTQYPTLLEVNGRKYQLHGNIIRSENSDETSAFMGIAYWVDVTEYDSIRQEYLSSRPVAGVKHPRDERTDERRTFASQRLFRPGIHRSAQAERHHQGKRSYIKILRFHRIQYLPKS